MNKDLIKLNKQFILQGRFVVVFIILTFFNLLVLYFLPGNICSYIIFVLVVVFVFKFLGLNSINILLCSIFHLMIAFIVELSKSHNFSYRLLGGLSFYVLALPVLATLVYVYEEKLEEKIEFKERKKFYLYFSLFLIAAFLLTSISLNITDVKVYFFNKFFSEKYFNEIDSLEVKGESIPNEMDFLIEKPGSYYLINGILSFEGWAIDDSNIPGTKIDYVGIYIDNKPQDGGEFIARCEYGIGREDVAEARGDEFKNSGFICEIDSNKIEDGLRDFYVYFHSNNFEWKYEKLELFIRNKDSFLFEDILDKKNKDIELRYSKISEDGEEIAIEEGEKVLKYIKFPVDIESDSDYLVSFKIKKIKNLDNFIHFDFFGEGYSLEQDYGVEHTFIDEEYKKVKKLISVGNVPSGKDIYFRIFTYSGGSAKIEELAVYKIIGKY